MPDASSAVRGGGEQKPRILVVDLVAAIARVVAELVGQLDRFQELVRGLLRQQLKAHQHVAPPFDVGAHRARRFGETISSLRAGTATEKHLGRGRGRS